MSPEAEEALAAILNHAKWLPTEIGPVAFLGLKLAEKALREEQDPIKYMRDILEGEAQKLAREKFG